MNYNHKLLIFKNENLENWLPRNSQFWYFNGFDSVLVPSSGVATVNLTAELRKEKVFGPTANPVIDIGLVSDLQEVLGKLEADANCLNSEMCQVNKMACGPK